MSTNSGAIAGSPPVATPGWVERIVRSPGRFCIATLLITVLGLALDSQTGLGGQVVLAACTWFFLAVAFVYLTPMERAQTSVVVVVATCAEIIGSVIWGVYVYRLGNLPLFVPPGHGLVYLTGLRFSQLPLFVARPRLLVNGAIAAVAIWALLGLAALGRTDVAGAVGAAILILFLLRGRMPTVYAGVFFAVAFLEIYGTAVGTWTWQEHIPGLGVPDGNPPERRRERIRVLRHRRPGAGSGPAEPVAAALRTGAVSALARARAIRGACLYFRGQGRRELGRSQGVRQRVLVPRSGVRILPPQPGRDSTFFPGTDTRTA